MTESFMPSLLAAAESTGLIQAVIDFLKKGGFFMIPLILTSIVGCTTILYKFLSLSRSRVIPDSLAEKISDFEETLAREGIEPLEREFRVGNSTLARLGAVALKHKGKSQAEITQAVEASAREETVHLNTGLGVLDVVITIAPLLGLLGTVSGLVVIFGGLGETTDHYTIARGIAEALNTTIAGLVIAVPCIIAHSYFARRLEALTARLEGLLAGIALAFGHPSSNA